MNQKEEAKKSKYYEDDLAMPPECDMLCRFRPCYNKGENKGTYTVGRGYTSYYSNFRPACMSRLTNGCPDRSKNVDVIKALEFIYENTEGITKTKAQKRRYTIARDTLNALIKYVAVKECVEE